MDLFQIFMKYSLGYGLEPSTLSFLITDIAKCYQTESKSCKSYAGWHVLIASQSECLEDFHQNKNKLWPFLNKYQSFNADLPWFLIFTNIRSCTNLAGPVNSSGMQDLMPCSCEKHFAMSALVTFVATRWPALFYCMCTR